jgi:hypothetical protein
MTQSERTLKSMIGKGWLTLRDIERLIKNNYREYDTQSAISARLREYGKIAAMGYERQTKIERINDKNVYFYRLKRL